MQYWVARIGFLTALVAFIALIAYLAATGLQILGILVYPWDAILIFGFSLLIATPFTLAMLALNHLIPSEKKFWTNGALIFAVMYNAFVTINYTVQLTATIPYSNAALAQTPHSPFWTLDALGYIFMGLATLFASPAFEMQGLQKWTKISFLANALVTPLIATVYFYPTSSAAWNLGSKGLSPPFSTGSSSLMLSLGLPWIITAPASMLFLALFLRSKSRP
jgi:hypothetical protein